MFCLRRLSHQHGGKAGNIGDQKKNDQLGDQAGNDPLGDLLDLDIADAAGNIQVDADRRCKEADGKIDEVESRKQPAISSTMLTIIKKTTVLPPVTFIIKLSIARSSLARVST